MEKRLQLKFDLPDEVRERVGRALGYYDEDEKTVENDNLDDFIRREVARLLAQSLRRKEVERLQKQLLERDTAFTINLDIL